MKTKVYMLGAGASKSSGVPLMSDFIATGYIRLTNSLILSEFLQYIQETYDIYLTNSSPSNQHEEYFKGQPIHADDSESMKNLDEKFGIEKIFEDAYKNGQAKIVTDFIFATISQESTHSSSISMPSEKIENENSYHRFIDNKIKEDLKQGVNVVIISFNYDLLLERALLEKGLGREFSYCIAAFNDSKNRKNFDSYNTKDKKNLKILKLHGSLNWLYCDNCDTNQLHAAPQFNNVHAGLYLCQQCKNPMRCLLIPPSLDKKFPRFFDPLWEEAKNALSAASEICVIGYSFRESDNKAIDLWKTGIKYNRNQPKIIIVNPHNKICDSIKSFDTFVAE